ncbi:MAG: hypothetical protein ACI8V2_004870 [Candidatus Latescibacterota bacterium]|jgi:hypothetical protein
MLASTSAANMTLPNLAFNLIMRTVQQSPAVSARSVTNEQGTRVSTPLASLQPVNHVDIKV